MSIDRFAEHSAALRTVAMIVFGLGEGKHSAAVPAVMREFMSDMFVQFLSYVHIHIHSHATRNTTDVLCGVVLRLCTVAVP